MLNHLSEKNGIRKRCKWIRRKFLFEQLEQEWVAFQSKPQRPGNAGGCFTSFVSTYLKKNRCCFLWLHFSPLVTSLHEKFELWLAASLNSFNWMCQLKMPGAIKSDFWTSYRKKISTGMRVSFTRVENVILVNVQFNGRMRSRLSGGKYTIVSKFDTSFISLNCEKKIPNVISHL